MTIRRRKKTESLTRDRVLQAAVTVVDREGLEALSMRRLGQEVGVEAMSLYRYVPSKADLLDGIHETILAELVYPLSEDSWVEAVRAYAKRFRKVLVAHPHAMPLFASRPAVTPSSLRHVERGLVILRGAGFGVDHALSAFQTIVTFVVGHTLATHAPVAADERSTPAYGALSATEFPALAEAASVLAEHDVDDEFAFGLDALLRGLEAKLSKQSKHDRKRKR